MEAKRSQYALSGQEKEYNVRAGGSSVADYLEFVGAECQTMVIHMKDGSTLSVPRTLIKGLATASPEQSAKWAINGLGTGLWWPELEVQLWVPALQKGIY